VLVLLLGVLVFVFYIFTPPPLLFSKNETERLERGPAAAQYAALQSEFSAALDVRRAAASELAAARASGDGNRVAAGRERVKSTNADVEGVRARAAALAREQSGDRRFSDTNYITPTFILTQLPVGLVGLLMLAIIMSATDTIAGELNSLSTATVMDFYKRWMKPEAADAHYLAISKAATGLWGLFACGVAVWAAELGSLIEVVNRFGSFFYGSILGVFILAIAVPFASGTGAFVGLIAGMSSVAWVASSTNIAFLWQNVVGAVAVVVAGSIVSLFVPRAKTGTGTKP
jgi:hypothetical protein